MGLENILQRLRRVDPDTILAAVAAAVFAIGVPAYLARQPSEMKRMEDFANRHLIVCPMGEGEKVKRGDTLTGYVAEALREAGITPVRREGKTFTAPPPFYSVYTGGLSILNNLSSPEALREGTRIYRPYPKPEDGRIPPGCLPGSAPLEYIR